METKAQKLGIGGNSLHPTIEWYDGGKVTKKPPFYIHLRHLICEGIEDSIFFEGEFKKFEDALNHLKQLASEISDVHGAVVEVEMRNYRGELICYARQTPKELPQSAVIVTFTHHLHMHYAYNIVGIRFAKPGETVADLHYQKDSVFAKWDDVYEDIHELVKYYRKGYGIFGKMNSGYDVIGKFIMENYCEQCENLIDNCDCEKYSDADE